VDVTIGEVVAQVRAVDGTGPISPEALEQIVRAVLQAVEARDRHRERVRAERRITGGVAAERESED
jgi:hypothetical protein